MSPMQYYQQNKDDVIEHVSFAATVTDYSRSPEENKRALSFLMTFTTTFPLLNASEECSVMDTKLKLYKLVSVQK